MVILAILASLRDVPFTISPPPPSPTHTHCLGALSRSSGRTGHCALAQTDRQTIKGRGTYRVLASAFGDKCVYRKCSKAGTGLLCVVHFPPFCREATKSSKAVSPGRAVTGVIYSAY